MAETMHSKRLNELKRLYFGKGGFNVRYSAIFGMLGMQRLSLRSRRWIEKRLTEMQFEFASLKECTEKIDELFKRNEDAKLRFERRMEKREAEKLKKKGWRYGKPPKADQPKEPEAPAPEPLKPINSLEDIWDLLPTKPEVKP